MAQRTKKSAHAAVENSLKQASPMPLLTTRSAAKALKSTQMSFWDPQASHPLRLQGAKGTSRPSFLWKAGALFVSAAILVLSTTACGSSGHRHLAGKVDHSRHKPAGSVRSTSTFKIKISVRLPTTWYWEEDQTFPGVLKITPHSEQWSVDVVEPTYLATQYDTTLVSPRRDALAFFSHSNHLRVGPISSIVVGGHHGQEAQIAASAPHIYCYAGVTERPPGMPLAKTPNGTDYCLRDGDSVRVIELMVSGRRLLLVVRDLGNDRRQVDSFLRTIHFSSAP
jgi:hypothetical protein